MIMPQERHPFGQRIGRVKHPMQPPRLQAGHTAGVQRGIPQNGFNGLKFVILRLRREHALQAFREAFAMHPGDLRRRGAELCAPQKMGGITSRPLRGVMRSQNAGGLSHRYFHCPSSWS